MAAGWATNTNTNYYINHMTYTHHAQKYYALDDTIAFCGKTVLNSRPCSKYKSHFNTRACMYNTNNTDGRWLRTYSIITTIITFTS